MRTVRLFIVAIFTIAVSARADNFCMDCVQKQTAHYDPGHLWYESEAMCCMWLCYG